MPSFNELGIVSYTQQLSTFC